MSEVILARHRNTEYTVRCEINGNEKKYTWKGSKGNKVDRKKVPQEVVDWLNMSTVCFNKGNLVIEGDDDNSNQLKDEIADRNSYDNNTHSREDVEKILKGNYKAMEKELKNITVDDEKRFVLDIALEMQDELTGGKQTQIAEWAGLDKDILFD